MSQEHSSEVVHSNGFILSAHRRIYEGIHLPRVLEEGTRSMKPKEIIKYLKIIKSTLLQIGCKNKKMLKAIDEAIECVGRETK